MAVLAIRYEVFYARHAGDASPHNNPKVGVLLPLRGPDPFLARCVSALLEQNYPDYVVRIVVDNPKDPAREVVEAVIREKQPDNVTVAFLEDFDDRCSLRSCAMRQAYRSLPDDCEVIILVDADARPDSNWINELVGGLQDPEVGVACGVRWYSPLKPTLVNLARHVWNAGAILQMEPLSIGWGGSFGIKKEAFEKAQLYDRWGSVMNDDVYSTELILQQGYKLKVLPGVTMVNEESITLKACFLFISRQLLPLRLYHRAWVPVCVYGLLAGLVTFASALTCIVAFALGQTLAGQVLAVALIAYFLFQALLTLSGEYVIRRTRLRLGKSGVKLSSWKLPFAVVLALVLHPICLLNALWTNSVTWRGIVYEIHGPQQIRRLNYEPFQAAENATSHSL